MKAEIKTFARVDRLPPLSFTYVIILFSKLYDDMRSLTYDAIATPNVLVTTKSPIVTWQTPIVSL